MQLPLLGIQKIISIIRNSWGPGYGRMAMLTHQMNTSKQECEKPMALFL
jgi:hypothetical protein